MKRTSWREKINHSDFSNSINSHGKQIVRAMIEEEVISYSKSLGRRLIALWLSHPNLIDLPVLLPYLGKCTCPERNLKALESKRKSLESLSSYDTNIVLPFHSLNMLKYIKRYYGRYESIWGQEPFYDVINADFCGALSKESSKVIESIFDYYVINDGGLLFLTVINKCRGNELVSGLEEIGNHIVKIAIARNYELTYLKGFPLMYKGDSKAMCSYGWKAKF